MGRVNSSLTRKLDEEIARLRKDVSIFLDEDEVEALEELIAYWKNNRHILSSYSNPYLPGSLCMLSLILVYSKIRALEKMLLEKGAGGE